MTTASTSNRARRTVFTLIVAALLTAAAASTTNAQRPGDSLSDHEAINARYGHLHGLKPTRHLSVDDLDAILGGDDDEAREAEREHEEHARFQRMAAQIEDEAARSIIAAANAAAEEAERKRIARVQECVAPFGDVLGTAQGVTAYSNCNDLTIVDELTSTMWTPSFAGKIGPGASAPRPVNIVTGLKWQCVEYSRRYMLITQGVVFGDVEGASDMWMLPFVSTPLDATPPTGIATEGLTTNAAPHKSGRFRFDRYRSFTPSTAAAWPEVGDHVIYRVQRNMPFGHTAVVVGIEATGSMEPSDTEDPRKTIRVATIRLAEQNFGTLWVDKTYSRVVELHRRGGTSFEASGRVVGIVDPAGYVPIGWLRARPEHVYKGPDLHTDLGEEPASVGETVLADGAVVLRRR